MKNYLNNTGKQTQLFNVLKPFILKLVQDAPAYGEITITAVMHDNNISRVSLGAEVSQLVSDDVNGGIE